MKLRKRETFREPKHETLRERIKRIDSELDIEYLQKLELTRKLDKASSRKRPRIERELSALQARIDYHQRLLLEAGDEQSRIPA